MAAEPQVVAAIAGVVSAVGFALWRLLKLVLDAMERQQKEFTKFLGNHMSSNTRAQEDVARALEKVADRLEEVERHAWRR